jgi:hypothetical protein
MTGTGTTAPFNTERVLDLHRKVMRGTLRLLRVSVK